MLFYMNEYKIYLLLFTILIISLISTFCRVCKRRHENLNRRRILSIESTTPPPKYDSPPDYQSINVEN